MDPHCQAFSNVGIATITLTAIGAVAIIITCSACCCINIISIKVALFMKFNLSFGQRLEIHNRKYDVFIVYNHDSDDQFFVLDEILPLLSKHKLNSVFEDCFELGVDQFTSLQDAMTKSRSVLVVLSANLLNAKWQLYQLNQAICTQIEQPNFKVVFLVCAKPRTLGRLPQNLQLFLRMGSSVEKYKKNWKGRLIYELTHKTKRSINRRLTFGNAEFRRSNLHRINGPMEVDNRIELNGINQHAQNHMVWRPSVLQNGL